MLTLKTAETTRLMRSFGRIKSRRLRPAKQKLLDEVLPKISLSAEDAAALQPPLQLEIGFGHGEHLAMKARLYPDAQFVGCEPFINGIGDVLKAIDGEKLNNIRLFTDDARLFLEALPNAVLSHVYILFPDPWPKSRQHKRRLIQTEFLDLLATKMIPGGELLLATDHVDYLTWMLEKLIPHPEFKWIAEAHTDWNTPPKDWVETTYQRKAKAEGRVGTWLKFICHPELVSGSTVPQAH